MFNVSCQFDIFFRFVDTFFQALGLTLRPLPKAISSENNYKRPATAEDEGSYVPMIAVDRLQDDYSRD